MRRLIAFRCEGDALVATLDEAAGTTGLLIVSGGNEVRGGAHRGMAMLAVRFAEAGIPVLRFDRRGVGDSEGSNAGYASSGPDIAAAAALFRRTQPQLARILGFGNCDAASALALFGRAAGVDGVVLANPWVVETDDLPPAAAIRRHYRRRLTRWSMWRKLLAGGIDLHRSVKGLRRIMTTEPQQLADSVIAAIADWGDNAHVIVAVGDATAVAFDAAAVARRLPTTITRIVSGSHSFAGPGDADALVAVIAAAVARVAKGTDQATLR